MNGDDYRHSFSSLEDLAGESAHKESWFKRFINWMFKRRV